MDEIGELTIEDMGDLRPRIATADRCIRVAEWLLDDECDGTVDGLHVHVDGDVLTIRDDYGQRYIYRIRWDDYADGGYLAEWPD